MVCFPGVDRQSAISPLHEWIWAVPLAIGQVRGSPEDFQAHAVAECLRQSRSTVSDRQCSRWSAMGTLQLSVVTPDAAALCLERGI
jgi:hypothetical protein